MAVQVVWHQDGLNMPAVIRDDGSVNERGDRYCCMQ
jgi:hypothetical protein